jgi:uncharacterized membrane protein YgcG
MQQLPTTHSGSLRWTDLTDEDIQHIIDEEIPPTLGDDKPSKAVMAAFQRAKRASVAQNAQSRQIAAECLQQRDPDAVPKVPCGQTMLTDYAAVDT